MAVQFGISAGSSTNVPQGESDFLLMNLMVIVVIIILVMLSGDLVIVVAPFDQRNVTFKYRLGSLPLNPGSSPVVPVKWKMLSVMRLLPYSEINRHGGLRLLDQEIETNPSHH